MNSDNKKSVSYSQLRNWIKCPHYHYLVSIEKEIPYPINKYTVLGTSIHNTCEDIINYDIRSRSAIKNLLIDNYIIEKYENRQEIDQQEIDQLFEPYLDIIPGVPAYLESRFPGFQKFQTEYKLEIGLNQFYNINW